MGRWPTPMPSVMRPYQASRAVIPSEPCVEDERPPYALGVAFSSSMESDDGSSGSSFSPSQSVDSVSDSSVQLSESSSEDDVAIVRNNFYTRIGRRKIPPNVPIVLIDDISFHSEDNVQRWKFVVQRCIVDEKTFSDQTKSCLKIMDLLQHVGLLKTVVNLSPFYPQLLRELIVNLPSKFDDPNNPDYKKIHTHGNCFFISPATINAYLGRTKSPPLGDSHPSVEEFIAELTGGIANWCPSTHGSSLSPSLASLLYQIGIMSTFNFEVFVYNQLFRHADSFAIKLPINLSRIFFGLLLSQCPIILGPNDAPRPIPKLLNLYYKIFRGTYALDNVHNIHPPKASNIPLLEDL
ncbi:uncharacterized protein LOC120090596 [Benincasa hispida]|uniref:uncharacterized protein LOC120090596 n=1 Tax=Benincasa hispida TaxID=102211 RepID=UPI0018FF4DED|nr:uncharacterized protein LOC120090596 [Benincasa hispida]